MVGLFAVLSEREAGDEIELLVQRGDEQITLTAVVDEPSNGRPERVFRQAMPLGIIPGDNFGFHMIPEIPLNESTGVRITEVVANSPAGRAGLEEGEVILAVNGEPVRFNGDLTRPIQQSRPGDELTLTIQDVNGDSREVTVTLGEDPSPEREGRAWLGISITPLRDKIDPGIPLPGVPSRPDGDQEDPIVPPRMVLPQFPEGYQTGALIQEVITGSPAEEASLEAGGLILEVNGETLETETDLADAIGALEPGDRVTLTVSEPADTLDNLTAPRVEEVEVTLGENPDESGAAYLGIRFSFVRMRMEREEVPGVPGAPGAWLPQPVPGT
jgi:S1-C subfamily serine protease